MVGQSAETDKMSFVGFGASSALLIQCHLSLLLGWQGSILLREQGGRRS